VFAGALRAISASAVGGGLRAKLGSRLRGNDVRWLRTAGYLLTRDLETVVPA